MVKKFSFCIFALFLIIFSQFAPSASIFGMQFRRFLRKTYGSRVEKWLTRDDLGREGSFGGDDRNLTVSHRPIIFVHGIKSNAQDLWLLRQDFMKRGYRGIELYASTYGSASLDAFVSETGELKCEYVKLIRLLVEAVVAYTNSSKVNVISYSMGVVVSRKAILGGNCVETGEYLGVPLTNKVKNFIGIAGPNHGSILCSNCILGKWLPNDILSPACNSLNGMSCDSKFIKDINSRKHYEGEFVYVIQTENDWMVGNSVCETQYTSRIEGADDTATFSDSTHISIHFDSTAKQYEFIQRNP